VLRCRSCYGGEQYALEQMLEFEGACGHCFGETHIYSFYLGLISGAARPPACAQHPAAELCASLGYNSTAANGTATNATSTFVVVQAAVQEALAQADAAAGPGGLIAGGLLLGLLVGCCCGLCRKKTPKGGGDYKPVSYE